MNQQFHNNWQLLTVMDKQARVGKLKKIIGHMFKRKLEAK